MFIPNKQERDTLLETLKGSDGYYSADKINKALAKYDLIIYTPEGVYDTTKYNQSKDDTLGFSTQVIANNNNGKSLELVYNPASKLISIQENKLNQKCRAVNIPERTIERVIVKGKRNFLQNRNPKED